MAKRPSSPDQRIILTKARAAGWKVVDTNSGWRVMSPDGQGQVTMHSSSSDVRAIHAMKADFKRAGLDLDAPPPKRAPKPQPTLVNEAIFPDELGLVVGVAPPEENVAFALELKQAVENPQFLPPQPLKTTNGRGSVRGVQPRAKSDIVWESPPAPKKMGRKSRMDKYRAAMVAHPGDWLVFGENVTQSMVYPVRKQYAKLGFEFQSQQMRAGDPRSWKVWARYVGVAEEAK